MCNSAGDFMNMKKFLCCALSASFLGGPTGFAYNKKGQAGQNYRIRHEKKIKDPVGLGSKSQRLGQSKEKSIKKKIKNPVGLGSKSQGLGQSKEKSILENAKEFVRNHKKGLIGTALGVGGLVGGYEFFNSALGIYILSKYIEDENFGGGRCNGGVYKRKHRISGKDYVFKCVGKGSDGYEDEKWASKKLRNCKDKRIKAPIRYISDFSGNCWFVSEVAPGKRREDYAVDISNCTYKEKLIKYLKIIRQFCQIKLVLFENGVSHNDLNTGNWFINEENGEPVVYVIDFGRCSETKGKCYIPLHAIIWAEIEIFGAWPFLNSNFVYTEGERLENVRGVFAKLAHYGNFEEKSKGFKLRAKHGKQLKKDQKLRLRNHMFGRLVDVVGYMEFNPVLSDDGCMSYEEVEKLCENGEGGYLSNGDAKLVKNFIDYLDIKISEISNMSDDEAKAICPYVDISLENIEDLANNDKKKWKEHDESLEKLCLKLMWEDHDSLRRFFARLRWNDCPYDINLENIFV